jgi:hypothetical protein
VPPKDRKKHMKEEEEAQNKSKRSKKSKIESETLDSHKILSGQSPSTYANGFSPMHPRHRTILNFLDQGCRDDMDTKMFKVLYACGRPFNVLHLPYWLEMVQAINNALEGYKKPEYDKARTMGLERERAKTHNTLGQ